MGAEPDGRRAGARGAGRVPAVRARAVAGADRLLGGGTGRDRAGADLADRDAGRRLPVQRTHGAPPAHPARRARAAAARAAGAGGAAGRSAEGPSGAPRSVLAGRTGRDVGVARAVALQPRRADAGAPGGAGRLARGAGDGLLVADSRAAARPPRAPARRRHLSRVGVPRVHHPRHPDHVRAGRRRVPRLPSARRPARPAPDDPAAVGDDAGRGPAARRADHVDSGVRRLPERNHPRARALLPRGGRPARPRSPPRALSRDGRTRDPEPSLFNRPATKRADRPPWRGGRGATPRRRPPGRAAPRPTPG